MYIGKHVDPEKAVEAYNEDMKAYIDLYREEIRDCGYNPERVTCWNELVDEFQKYRVDIVTMLYKKGVRTAILRANGKYELVGPLYRPQEIFPF